MTCYTELILPEVLFGETAHQSPPSPFLANFRMADHTPSNQHPLHYAVRYKMEESAGHIIQHPLRGPH
jgi:hypothetical protein